MAKGNDAADVIRRIVKQNEQLKLAAEILDEFGSLDNAIAETRNKLDAVKKELDSELDKLVAAKVELNELKEKLEKQQYDTELACARMLDEANHRIAEMEAKAKETASNIVDDAIKQSEIQKTAASEHIASLAAQRDELLKEVGEYNATYNKLKADADKAEQKLNKIKSDIAKMAGAANG